MLTDAEFDALLVAGLEDKAAPEDARRGGAARNAADGVPAPVEWRTVLDDDATNSRVRACDNFLPPADQAALFRHCAALTSWEYDRPFPCRGKTAHMRRGMCMQGDPSVSGGYRFSGQTIPASPLDGVLGPLLGRVNRELGTDFNSWLLNMYRPRGVGGSAGDYLSPHSDDERQLATASDGRSVVFGLTLTDTPACVRSLVFEPVSGGAAAVTLATRGGQAYTMEGATQRHWKHGVPRRPRVPGTRISLTARRFVRWHPPEGATRGRV